MKLAGSYKLNIKKEIVWQALNDANILKQCIPGCESFEIFLPLIPNFITAIIPPPLKNNTK